MNATLVMQEDFAENIARRVAELMAPPAAPRWMTVEETAELLACSIDHVRNAYKAGELFACKPGKRVLIESGSVDAYIRSRQVRT